MNKESIKIVEELSKIMEVAILNGPSQLKKETSCGRQDTMFIIQSKL